MLKTRFEWMILMVLATLLGTAWIVVSKEPVTPDSGPITLTEAPIVGYRAPDFTLSTPLGQTVTLSEIVNEAQGQPVVLNFWASWCAPCRVEMPHFQNASRNYNGRIAFIGVNQGENAQTVTEFGNEFGITYPLLVDEENEVSRAYSVNSLPTTVFIGPDGVVREVVIGILSQAVLEDRAQTLLAEKP